MAPKIGIGKVSGAPYASRRVPGRPLDEVLDLICEPVFPPGKAAATVHTDALDEAVRAAEISRVDAATVAELASALEVLDPDEPKKWIDIGYALASLKNTKHEEQARDLWIDWIQRGAKYQDGDERRWDGLDATRTDFRAIFAEAARKGWANPRKAVLETERDRSIRIARDGEYQVPTQRVLTGTEMLAELVYIKEGARVQVDVDESAHRIILTPVTRDYIQNLHGKYKGKRLLSALATEKKRERER